jgi:hypothetical protein
MAYTPEELTAFATRGEALESQLQALLQDFRTNLGDDAPDPLVFAESDLYDAIDCLNDFVSACKGEQKKD